MRLMPASLLLLCALLAAAPAKAADLCQAGERPVFTCPTARAILSLCQGKAAAAPALSYRFGRPGAVAFAYPTAPSPAAAHFAGGTLAFSGGGGAYVQFHNGAFGYTVFTAIGQWGKAGEAAEVAGVDVSQGGKEVHKVACTGPAKSSLGPDLFQQLRLPQAQDFEIPDSMFPK